VLELCFWPLPIQKTRKNAVGNNLEIKIMNSNRLAQPLLNASPTPTKEFTIHGEDKGS
jgi:hypothetical protein